MFALLGQARRVTNPELQELIGFRLDGMERRKLNELKLVESEKQGRAFAHELSDIGWRWCADELRGSPSGRGGSMERALYALLGGLDRYLGTSGQSLADVFGPGRADNAPDTPVAVGEPAEDRINAAYHDLAAAPGEFVRLRDLRGHVADIPAPILDAALTGLYASQRINLIPQSNQQALTPEDLASAVRVGGEFKHLISIE